MGMGPNGYKQELLGAVRRISASTYLSWLKSKVLSESVI